MKTKSDKQESPHDFTRDISKRGRMKLKQERNRVSYIPHKYRHVQNTTVKFLQRVNGDNYVTSRLTLNSSRYPDLLNLDSKDKDVIRGIY